MRNKAFVLMLSFILVLCSSFSVFASTTTAQYNLQFPFAEPVCSSNQGYFVASDGMGNDSNTLNQNIIYMWTINPYAYNEGKEGSSPSVSIRYSSTGVVMDLYCNGSAYYTVTAIINGQVHRVQASGQFDTAKTLNLVYNFNAVAYCWNGNVGLMSNSTGIPNPPWLNVTWGLSSQFNEELSDIVLYLEEIYGTLSDVEANTDGLETTLSNIKKQVDYIEGDTEFICELLEYVLDDCDLILSELQSHTPILNNIENRLDDIYDLLKNSKGKETTDKLDDSSIDDLESSEGGVLDDSSDMIYDIEIGHGSGFEVVWNLISSFWQANSKVFTVVIMCLSIGLIKLIFNR